MEEFIIYIEANKEIALSVFEKYYNDKSIEEGEIMLYDETFCEDNELEPLELYEEFAHITGHSATYYGAEGVIRELGVDYQVDEDDEDIQWEVLLILEKEPS